MKGFRDNKEWSDKSCNPFNNMENRYKDCEARVHTISIPETPFISTIVNPLGLHPFIKVNQLRTKIQGFNFMVKEKMNKDGDWIYTKTFETHNYQNYAPTDTFKKGRYYEVSCVARNEAGFSDISNKYYISFPAAAPVAPPTQKIICGGEIICDIPILCG